MKLASIINRRVRALMAEQNKSQRALCKRLGLTPPTVSQKLKSDHYTFNLEDLVKISDWLGVTFMDLIRDDDTFELRSPAEKVDPGAIPDEILRVLRQYSQDVNDTRSDLHSVKTDLEKIKKMIQDIIKNQGEDRD